MDFYRKTLTDLAARILSDSGRSDAELSILVTGDEEMRTLNRSYRDVDRATDVLSFSQIEGENPAVMPDLLGDVVISWEAAQRQARQLDCAVASEMKRLLVHGILHLLGYDHENDAAGAAVMREMEEKYLETVDSEK